MDTLLLLVFYPAVAMLVYTMLVIREMYLRQVLNKQASSLNFLEWITTSTQIRTRRRYLIYLIGLMVAIIIILIILTVYPFANKIDASLHILVS